MYHKSIVVCNTQYFHIIDSTIIYLFIKHAPLLCSNTTCCDLHVSFISEDAVTNIVSYYIPFTISFQDGFGISI
jgi:hypothetical protein